MVSISHSHKWMFTLIRFLTNNHYSMKVLIRIVIACVVIGAMSGCVEWLNHTNYKVRCTVDKSLRVDSVTLMLLEEDYNQLQPIYHQSKDSSGGSFTFEGQIEHPCVAFLKFSNDSTPFFFVLEPGEIEISIAPSSVVINGGELNHSYVEHLKLRRGIAQARNKLWQEYLNLAAPDSMVNIAAESDFVRRDSLLVDSLERLTVAAINAGGPVSRILSDRFVNTLSDNNLLKISK